MSQHLKAARAELVKGVEADLARVQATPEFQALEHSRSILAQVDAILAGTTAPPKKVADAKATVKPAKKAATKKATTKKATTKAATGGKKVTKTGFILSFALNTPAKKIVAAAEKKGMSLTTKMVYSVRSANKAKAAGANSQPAKAATKKKATKKKTAKKAIKAKAKSKGKGKGKAKKKAVAKKKASNGASAAAAEGRRQVALGLRPSLRASMVKIMVSTKKPMDAGDMVDALTAKGWLPQGKDPRGYVLYMFSKKPDTFKRTDRGVYTLQPGVTVASVENKTNKKKASTKKASTKKATTAAKQVAASEVKEAVQTPPSQAQALADLGIGVDGNVDQSPFAAATT